MTSLAPTLQAYFTTRLTSQYGASPHTVAAYRDTLALVARLRRTDDRDRPSGSGRHCQLEQSEGDFRRFASAIHQVACDV